MRFFVLAALLLLVPAQGQESTQRITGVIENYAAPVLTVKTAKGKSVAITLTAGARVLANTRAVFSSIHQGDFIASTSSLGKDGRLAAKEVRIFPLALRGLGEGQYPHGSATLTNATVVTATAAPKNKGGVLRLSFHGAMPGPTGLCTGHASAPGQGACTGETEIALSAKTPITAWDLGDESWLQTGKAVSLYAVRDTGGSLSSPGVLVEHNGVKPLP